MCCSLSAEIKKTAGFSNLKVNIYNQSQRCDSVLWPCNGMLSVTANDKRVVESWLLWHWVCHCPGSSLKIISCRKVECLVHLNPVCWSKASDGLTYLLRLAKKNSGIRCVEWQLTRSRTLNNTKLFGITWALVCKISQWKMENLSHCAHKAGIVLDFPFWPLYPVCRSQHQPPNSTGRRMRLIVCALRSRFLSMFQTPLLL